MVVDMPIANVFAHLGHDGSEIVWPDEEEPKNRKGFHIQEIYALLEDGGFFAMPFDKEPISCNNPQEDFDELGEAIFARSFIAIDEAYKALEARMHPIPNQDLIINQLMLKYDGVLLGLSQHLRHHAVAWNHNEQLIYNPSGLTDKYIEGNTFTLSTFIAIAKII